MPNSFKRHLELEGVTGSRTLKVYKEHGGYSAVKKALAMSREEVQKIVMDSGLRGRGGAGFRTGLKWSFVPKDDGKPKYLICNNDESEPGTFKDRHLCSVSPHSIIEGMIIAAYCIGASKGYIYTRWEFQLEIGYLEDAIKEAYAAGLLGKELYKSGFKFDLDHYSGAGAYICGEETGLISSLEGKKGQPKLKPPFPAISGYLQRPTVVNNTETLASVPWIINNGSEAYRSLGTEKSPGTKLFSISGAVNKPGVYEVPLGYPLQKLIDEQAGGMKTGKKLKAVIPGGISAPLLTAEEVKSANLDYENLAALDTMLGSGAVMVIDEDQNMTELLTTTIAFFSHESCGQCTPCREGTGWLLNIVRTIQNKLADKSEVDRLKDIALHMSGKTICALAEACKLPTVSYVDKYGDEIKEQVTKGL